MRGVRIVDVGGVKVGLSGLNTIFERLYVEGWEAADSGFKEALIAALRQAGNYITHSDEPAYATAIGELYRQFCAANAASGKRQD
jgi:hypothetical protein